MFFFERLVFDQVEDKAKDKCLNSRCRLEWAHKCIGPYWTKISDH